MKARRAARLAPMPGIRAILSALVAATCAIAFVACGSDEEGAIPKPDGELLLTQLERIDDAVQNGECDAARATAAEFAETVDQLPEEVDGELRQGLVEASANLEQLTQDPEQCAPEGATGVTGETPTPPAPTPPTTPDEPEDDEPEDDEPSDDDGPGRGNGPPAEPPGGGNGAPPADGTGDEESSGGIGSDG